MKNLYLVVMAGGSGTRFWPKSTSKRPKQLLSFGPGGSLLSQTLARFEGLVPENQRLIVTTQALEKAMQNEKFQARILAEPQGRNTAPCVYWSARVIEKENPNAVILVMPADHYIAHPDRFLKSLNSAIDWASKHDDLVTLAIKPTRPETGYGYLRTGAALDPSINSTIAPRKVEAFIEKPNLEKAQKLVASGNTFWNGGMFVWRAKTILQAFDRVMPEMKVAWEESGGNIEKAYPKMTAISIDFGVMEKADNVATVPLDCGWDDLGSWTSLENLSQSLGTQSQGNVLSNGSLISVESDGNIIDAPGRLVTLLGVQDLIVVESGEAILIAKKDRAQDIRKIVDEAKKKRPDLV